MVYGIVWRMALRCGWGLVPRDGAALGQRRYCLIFSWSWLIIGVFVLVFMVYFIPKVMANLPANGAAGHPAAPAAAMGIVMVVMILVFGFG